MSGYRIVETARGRQIGFRRLGAGPPVVMLHESPRSSAALLPLAERLADRFTLFALDNPGFGLSAPLDHPRPDAADFADALAEAFDALGVARAPVYGSHTGAVIAMEFARRHPARCAGAVFDGYPVFTAAEQEESMASYLAPIRPEWEPNWLAWLWGRVRDQYAFFPWYRRGRGARLPRPLPPADFLQLVANDFLAAGDAYRPAYASAFRYDAAAPIAETKPPIVFAAREDDLLFGHLDRLPPLPAKDRILRLTADREAWGRAQGEALAAMAVGTAPADPGPQFPAALDPARAYRRFVAAGAHRLHVWAAGTKPDFAVVVLHGAPLGPGHLATLLPWFGRLAGPVLAFDLPGQGGSTPAPAGLTLAALAEIAEAAIGQLAKRPLRLISLGPADAVAAAVASRGKVGVERWIALDPPADDAARRAPAEHLVDIAPKIHGGHLMEAWFALRDAQIWKPWFDRTPAASRDVGTDPDVPALAADLTEWFRGGPSYRETLGAMLTAPMPAAAPHAVIGFAGDPDAGAQAAMARRRGARFVSAGRRPHEIAAAVAAALQS